MTKNFIKKNDLVKIAQAMLGAGYYEASRHSNDEEKIKRLLIMAFDEIFKQREFHKTLNERHDDPKGAA